VKTEDFGDVHDALKVLRGKKGSRVTITVLRGDTRQRKQFTIKRAIITIPGIRGARVIEGENRIGYVYVAEFHEKVAGDLEKRIMELVDQNVDGIIIDLRFNRGGLLDAALNVSDLFLDDGIIVSTKGRTSPLRVFRARQSQIAEGMPIVVLANRYSASAAEIVTAALRDNDRARFVGESTFGKASVQTIIEHPDEQSAIKLTTGRYYTPTGDLIEGEGVSPDVEEKLSDEDLLRLMQHLSRELDAGAEEEPEDEGEAAAEPAEPEVEVESPGEAAAAAEPEEPFQDVQLDRALAEMAQMLEGATEEAVPVQAVEAPEPARVN